MGRVDAGRVIWWFHRIYLRHGAATLVAMLGGMLLLGLLGTTAWSHLRLARAERELAELVQSLRSQPAPQERREKVQLLPLPAMTQRFAITRKVIDTLAQAHLEPERIRFKFEPIQDAGLTRQVAVFTLKARWSDIAAGLARLQAADRSLYISRLRLSRETPEDEMVSAEVQLAVALLDGATPVEDRR